MTIVIVLMASPIQAHAWWNFVVQAGQKVVVSTVSSKTVQTAVIGTIVIFEAVMAEDNKNACDEGKTEIYYLKCQSSSEYEANYTGVCSDGSIPTETNRRKVNC